MTNHLRLYAIVLAAVVLFVSWGAVAARPWAKADPRLAALAQRERLLRTEARLVKLVLASRAAASHTALTQHQGATGQLAAGSAAPAVRVINLPPLTITRTS